MADKGEAEVVLRGQKFWEVKIEDIRVQLPSDTEKPRCFQMQQVRSISYEVAQICRIQPSKMLHPRGRPDLKGSRN